MLKAQIDTLDGVDEKYHGLYQEKDGKYHLTGVELPDVDGLKSALQSERENAKKLAADKAELDKKLAADKMKQAESDKDIEAIKAQMAELHKQELDTYKSKAENLTAELNKIKIDNVALDAIAKERGIAELLTPYVKQRTRLTEDGKVEVLTADGKPMVDKDGNSIGVHGLVKSLKENKAFAGAFEGTTHTGGGSKGEEAPGGAAPKSSVDKIASGLAKLQAGTQ